MTDLARPEHRPLAELAGALEETRAGAIAVHKKIASIENFAFRVDRRLEEVRKILEEQEVDERLWGRTLLETPTEKYLREQLQRLHLALEGL